MQIKVVRRLSVEETLKRIRSYEHKYRMTFDEFERMYLQGRLEAGLFGVYLEWAGLIDAYRGYQENGELDYAAEETVELSDREFERLLTHKRLELLAALSSLRVDSINDLSRKLRRNVKNVYYDLKALEKLGIVRFRRVGDRNVIPEAVTNEISIRMQ